MLGAGLRQWHDERWGDGRMLRAAFSPEALGARRDAAAILALSPQGDGFVVEHVGPGMREIIGALEPGDAIAANHPMKTFIDYVAMIGDPVMVLGETLDAESRPQGQNVLLLPVVADIRTVGWIVAIREAA